ncbi:MAG: flagellar biosynthesis regulator FlaF [Rhodospirillales bacterium]
MQQASENLPVVEEQAFQLSQAAIRLDQARTRRTENPSSFSAALDENLDVWMAIRTVAQRSVPGFSNDIRNNLVKLSHFVADTTFAGPENVGDSTLDTLININLQISEGLLEARVGA